MNGKFKTPQKKKEHPVYLMLTRNRSLAFTVKEIARDVRMKENTVRSMLRVLIKEKKVLHITPYWIAK